MPSAEKRSITLSPELASMIDNAVAGGEYASASEVVREALREWKQRRQLLGHQLEELRALWREGADSGEARPLTQETIASIKETGRRRLADRK